MRVLAMVLLAALPAHADLYRWVDPQTGSVKFSNLPPAEPGINAELVPYRGPTPPAKPPAPVVAAKPAARAEPASVSALEARLQAIFAQLTGATPQDFNRSGEALRQQIEAYEAVKSELDRLDPAGAARRRNESTTLLERLRQGFAAQFSTVPPGQK